MATSGRSFLRPQQSCKKAKICATLDDPSPLCPAVGRYGAFFCVTKCDNTLFPPPSTGNTSVNVGQEPLTSYRRGSGLRAFSRLCFRDGETLLFSHKICLSRPTVPYARRFRLHPRRILGAAFCAARPREERDENEEDIVYRPVIENWPRPSYLSVPNIIKQLGKT